ncbi:translocation/assembly module TamB domain-containing protein [Primorskyibacter sp. S87]|uniref:translocation/assembly module TamB domain-containing protein n=1 Tax=Primorskyibacter sp. S87 TaxID=3415126 RepID=UPI003C7E6A94
MNRFLAYPLAVSVVLAPGLALGQEDDDGSGSMLERFLEDSLSGEDQKIRVVGLEGALSARATIEQVEVSDEEGPWLTINNAVLDWNRLALVRGRFSVNSLSAGEIVIARAPIPAETAEPLPSPETQPFQVPELPVSVELGEIKVERLTLGESLMGMPAELELLGSLTLADGNLDTNIAVTRLDRPGDEIDLIAGFSNETSLISLDLKVIEDAGGLISTTLSMPDQPPLLLTAKGEGPVTDFTADIALTSDATQSVSGQVRLQEVPTPNAADEDQKSIAFTADLGGDLTPFLQPEFDEFFGNNSELAVSGRSDPDGRLELDNMRLSSDALTLEGEVALAGGVLELADVNGQITPPEGDDVVLPIGTPPTALGAARFAAQFDKEAGNHWTLDLNADRISQEELSVGRAAISAKGTLDQSEGLDLAGEVQADLNDLELGDDALDQAVGREVLLTGRFAMQGDGKLQLDDVVLTGSDYKAEAEADIQGLQSGFSMDGAVSVEASDLSRFSGVAGRDLGGSVQADLTGNGAPLGGNFAFTLDMDARDLAAGDERFDPLIAGATTLYLDAERGENGIGINQFELNGTAVDAKANGAFRSADSGFWMDGAVSVAAADLSLFSALAGQDLAGSVMADLTGKGAPLGGDFAMALDLNAKDLAAGIEQVDALIAGTTTLKVDAARGADGIDVNVFDLNGSALSASASGALGREGSGLTFKAALDDLKRVIPSMKGPLTLAGDVAQDGEDWAGEVRLTGPDSSFAELDGKVSLKGAADLDFDAEFNRLERFLPELSGSLKATGNAKRDGGVWTIDTTAKGPAGIEANVAGNFDEASGEADLGATGSLSLNAANLFISPNSVNGDAKFDITVKGKPSIETVSGTVTTSGTKVAIPSVGQTIDDLSGRINLSEGGADLNITASLAAGGGVRVSGPVTLSAPFDGRIAIALDNLVLTDNITFDSSANGQLVFAGQLAGNSNLTGQIFIGETNIDLSAASGAVGAAPIPPIRHSSEPGAVFTTRQHARLVEKEKSGGGESRIGLDVEIIAPNKIFARGRGLNAELGGDISIRGTTAAISPAGQIELIRGNLDLLGRRLKLTKGLVTLQGNLLPYIEFASTTSTSEGTSTLEISGPINTPTVKVFAEPERPSEEALAMLLFGNRFSEISPIVLAQMAASLAVLSGAGGDSTKGIRNATGVDSVQAGADEDGNAQVGAGTYLFDNLYTDFTVNTAGETEVNLNYNVSESVTLKGTVDNAGETSVGVFFSKDY